MIPWAALAIGVALFTAGIAVLAGRRIAVRLPTVPRASGERGYASVLVFGIGYGVAYAAGMGTMLTALAVAAALSRAGLANHPPPAAPHSPHQR